jgi:polysaccharide pyruvyl transferase WcaK-like protein/O-antigen/teichoic acid export membrane protein
MSSTAVAAEPLSVPAGGARNPLYKNGIALVINSALSSVIGAAYWLVVARRASTQVVGEATALVSALMALSMIAQMSLPGVLATYLPRAGSSARRLVLRAYGLSILVSLVLGAGFVLIAPRIAPAFHLLAPLGPALLFPIAIATWSIFGLQDNALTGLRRAIWVPLENTLYSAAKLAALFLLGSGAGALALLATWVAPAGLALLPVSGVLIFRLLPIHAKRRQQEDLHGLRRYFAGDSVGLILGQISTTLLPVLVIVRLGAIANGSFGIAWMIVQSLDLIAINLGMSLTVEGAHDEQRVPALLNSLRAKTGVLILALATVGIAIAPQLLSIFGPSYAAHGSTVFRLLLLGSIGRAIITLEICAARAQRRPMRIVRLQASLATLIPASAWMLAGVSGLTGVGIAYAGSQLLVAAAVLFVNPTRRSVRGGAGTREAQPIKSILCVNHWHDDNKGDSAITGGILRLVEERWPDARIRVATLNEARTSFAAGQLRHLMRQHEIVEEWSFSPTEFGSARSKPTGTLATTARWLTRLLPCALEVISGTPRRATRRRLADVDLVIAVGGSNIYDDPDVAAPLSLARLFGVLYPIWAAGRVGVPVALAGHTLGPFPRRPARLIARWMLKRVNATVLREATSLDTAAKLGLGDAHVAPDMAFATPAELSSRVRGIVGGPPGETPTTLGLAIRQHPHAGSAENRRIALAFGDFARACQRAGIVDRVLVIAQCVGPTAIEDDRPISRELARLLEDLPAILVEQDLSPEELAALYGHCRIVLSVRLHAAILALSQGRPAFSVAYMTRKTEGVMELAGQGGTWCAFRELSPALISAALPDMLAAQDRGAIREMAQDNLARLRQEVARWEHLSPAR